MLMALLRQHADLLAQLGAINLGLLCVQLFGAGAFVM